MRATLNIPDDLLSEVQKITGEKSKTKAITVAMKEYVRQKKIKELIALRGKIQIDYDWEKEEELEMKAQKEREELFEQIR
ncbi:MAG: type II toxin-antitoxin system VapB family antitoxin [Thermodesulfobacteriota bacterium]